MHDRGIDVSKFESWPLLPPDELASLPTEVLRASVVELELMCIQASDGSGKSLHFPAALANRTLAKCLIHSARASCSPQKN